MHTNRTLAALLIAAALLLTACSNDNRDTGDEPAPSMTTVTPTADAAMPEPAPSSTAYAIGETAKIDDDTNDAHFTATVLAYTQPVKGPISPDEETQGGDVWATVEVKVCNTQGVTFSVSQFPWSLAYEDGTRIEVTGSTGGDLPKPEFPMDALVKAGDCVRGKIPYAVPSDARPERIVYEPESLTEPAEWAVPAA